MNKPEFDEYFKRRDNIGDYVDWVASGDHSKPFEPPARQEVERCLRCGEHYDVKKYGSSIDHVCQECAEIESARDKPPEISAGAGSPFEEVIDCYSRAQALDDGVLVDVTQTAKEAGIVYPTAVTQALWDGYIVPPESLKGFQDVQGRLWDVLTMFSTSARAMKKADTDVVESQKDTAQTLYFKTIFQMPSKTINPKIETVDLKAVCGPGDDARPVLTIMLANES